MKKIRPSRRLLIVWGIYGAFSLLLLFLLTLLLPVRWRLPVIGVAGGILLLAAVYLPLRLRTLAYTVDTEHLTVRGGLLFHSEKRIPTANVRYTTLVRGIPEHLCGICTLALFVTGGIVLLEGLYETDAAALQRQLSEVPHNG